MSMQYFSIWTQAGLAKKAQAIATGQPLLITHMAIGDTGSNDGSSPPAPNTLQTSLRNEKHRQQITDCYISPTDQNQTVFSITVLEDVGGFWIKEVGLFADDDTLIAVGSYAPSYKADIASGSPSQIQCNMLLLEASAEVIKVQIDPTAVLASKRYVDEKLTTHETAANPHAQYALSKDTVMCYATVPTQKREKVIYVEGVGVLVWNGTQYEDITIYTKYDEFAAQKSKSGYQKLPGGLIIQWVSILVNNNQPYKVNLPIVFPNDLLNVQVSNSYMNNPAMAGSGDNYFQVQQYDNESVTVFLQYFGNVGLYPAYAEILTIGY